MTIHIGSHKAHVGDLAAADAKLDRTDGFFLVLFSKIDSERLNG